MSSLSMRVVERCARDISAAIGETSPCSPAQFRKLNLNPAGGVGISSFLKRMESPEFLMYSPLFGGKIRLSPASVWPLAWANTSLAWVERGTRCRVSVFIREPGMVHMLVAMSTSSQVARRASPLRAQVKAAKMRQHFSAQGAFESRMLARAAPSRL